MRTMYMPGSEIHVHSDYIVGHHHTLLKIIEKISTSLHHDVCWGLVFKCFELRTRQHKYVKYKHPSSAEALSPQGFNELQTKVISKVSRRFHLRDHICKTIMKNEI
jgi:abortive infection bacteriophage resistance protein